jgi:hypothetical protein
MSVKTEMIEIVKSVSNNKENNKTNNLNIFNTTLEIVKEKISVIELRANTVHMLIKFVIEELDNTVLKGTEKKEVALKILKEIIINFTEGEDERKLLEMINDGTVGNLIDLVIDASKGKLNINSIISVSVGCANTCCPGLFKSKSKK